MQREGVVIAAHMHNLKIDVLHQQGTTVSVQFVVGCPDVDHLYNPGSEITGLHNTTTFPFHPANYHVLLMQTH